MIVMPRKLPPGRVPAAWSVITATVACLCAFIPPLQVAIGPLGATGLVLALVSWRLAARTGPAKPSDIRAAGLAFSLTAVLIALAFYCFQDA